MSCRYGARCKMSATLVSLSSMNALFLIPNGLPAAYYTQNLSPPRPEKTSTNSLRLLRNEQIYSYFPRQCEDYESNVFQSVRLWLQHHPLILQFLPIDVSSKQPDAPVTHQALQKKGLGQFPSRKECLVVFLSHSARLLDAFGNRVNHDPTDLSQYL